MFLAWRIGVSKSLGFGNGWACRFFFRGEGSAACGAEFCICCEWFAALDALGNGSRRLKNGRIDSETDEEPFSVDVLQSRGVLMAT
jgi:hypothetical protein